MAEQETRRQDPQELFRPATPEDAVALRNCERDTNLVALGHVFPPEQYPFPHDAALARWREELEEPGCRIDVVDGPPGTNRIDAYVAYDDHVIRHLAVHPEAWRRGLGRAAVERAASRMVEPTLWCLDLNFNAHRFYAALGWERTGVSKPGEWPPFPRLSEWAPRRDAPQPD